MKRLGKGTQLRLAELRRLLSAEIGALLIRGGLSEKNV